MTPIPKRLSIILPSFNDPKIVDAIESVRIFDDLGTVQLLVIDGGSQPELLNLIRPLLRPDDILISESDRGIFDALNKGLFLSTTEFIGWLGSDDRFSGQVRASHVVDALLHHDLFVTSLAVFRGDRVRRVTHSLPSRIGLVKYGLHNPHFATFGRAALLKSVRFRLDLLGSDIDYFLRVFAGKPRVATTNSIGVLMREGGFSSRSYRKIVDINLELFAVYAAHTNQMAAVFALGNKFAYKCAGAAYYKLVRRPVSKICNATARQNDDLA